MLCFTVAADQPAFPIGAHEFRLFMDLASDYQWSPAGTQPDPDSAYYHEPGAGWNGGYMRQEGELVTTPDATAWANSLERALQVHAVGLGDTQSAIYLKAKEFVEFLRLGGFQVY